MNRRAFLAALAVPAVHRPYLVLEAISGPRLPERRVVWGCSPAPFFEWRVYTGPRARLELLHQRFMSGEFGIPVASACGSSACGSYLIPFDSLGQRAAAWTRLASHPEWIQLREDLNVSEITVYQPGGRIFDMSL